MKKSLSILGLVLVSLLAVLFIRAQTHFDDSQFKVTIPIEPITLDEEAAVERFAKAIQFPTISNDDREQFDPEPFLGLHQHIKQSFPLVHQHAKREVISNYSLVYSIEGSDPSLKPALFMGHMDVVPVDEATRPQWKQGPFSGAISENTIWGRGTIDDKVSVMALLESLELLLSNNTTPKRSIYFAFGHDEEVGGNQGAAVIAQHFAQQNLQFEFVLDEGGAITQDLMVGVTQPVAIIGIAEKGYVNLKLTVNAEGGHSSQAPNHTAAGILSQAIVNIEANQFPANLSLTQDTFERVGYYTPLSTRLPMANLWLLSPIVENVMLKTPSSAAGVRTTTAVTMLKGSAKSNILPTQATATVNFRLFPGDSIEYVTQRITKVIDDPRVQVEAYMGNEASPVSDTDSFGYKLIESTIRRLDDNILVAPYLVQGGTDAKHFVEMSDSVYRFMMVRLSPKTLKRFHGVNEQITVDDYLQAIQFYYALLAQTANG